MRLHRLTIAAFGPFADEVDLDLDQVSAAGLFLIHGPTGAGKTSLLDAICYALYADLPGSRGSGRSLRSDHAPRDCVPRVTLEFTASGRRFRIERSPEFVRPKKRGLGETRAPARVTLQEQVGGTWVGKDSRPDDVAAVVRDVLGLGLSQFSKVVMLPQGGFAAFLRATPEERRQVLERLFDVQRFTDVEEWLSDQRRLAVSQTEQHRHDLASELDRLGDLVLEIPGLAVPRDADPSRPAEVTAAVDRLVGALSDLVTTAMAASDAAMAHEASAQREHTDARRLVELQERARTARTGLVTLQRASRQRDEAERRLELARRAAPVSGHLAALQRARAAAGQALERRTAAEAELARAGLTASERLLGRLHEHDDVLRDVAKVSDDRTRQEADRTVLRARLHDAEYAVEVHRERMASAVRGVEEAREAMLVCDRAAAGLPGAVARDRNARRLHRTREDYVAAGEQIDGITRRHTELRQAEQDARQRLLDLREARVEGMAAELADRLADGVSCPVCGALEHPRPARAVVRVEPAEVAAAESAWEAAARGVEEVALGRAAAEAAQAARCAALAEVGGDPDLAAEVLRAECALRQAQEAAAALPAARERLRDAEQTLVVVSAEGDRLTAALATALAAHAAAEAALARQEALLASLLADHASACPCVATDATRRAKTPRTARAPSGAATPAIQERHTRALHAATAWAAAEEGLDRETSLVAAAEAATTTAMEDAGFASVEELTVALVDPSAMDELDRLVKAHDQAQAALEATVADPEVSAAEPLPTPDVDALAAAHREAAARHLTARSAQAVAERTLSSVTRLRDRITERCTAYVPVLERSAHLRELADTVGGIGPANTRRMRLSSFVLAARLENVARLANERLAVMGDGRYRLRHSDELAARGARSGLGLEVLDLWTGQSRATSTLSGGEAFMASLALALGLADAVREEAGGFDLQTLFIDEGFGTLDDDSLEQVLAVLDELREGGRAVGVVSHVPELRTRITSQVQVHKTASGSSVVVSDGRDTAA